MEFIGVSVLIQRALIFLALFFSTLILVMSRSESEEMEAQLLIAPNKSADRIFDKQLLRSVMTHVPAISQTQLEGILEHIENVSFKDFPKKVDILAIIGVESTFRQCETDGRGSYGLMQVNIKAHKLDPGTICDTTTNISHGSKILRENYLKLGSEQAAVLAYNVGIGGYLKGEFDVAYYNKYLKWKRKLKIS